MAVTTEVLDGLREQQDTVRPKLQLLLDEAVERLRREIATRGVHAVAISGRVKDTPSLVKKALRKSYADPWDDIHDKAGIRATAVLEADLPVIEQCIRDLFTVTHYEDKRTALDPSSFDYLGLHFEVTVPDPIAPDCPVRDCEIQVRTSAQSVWADVSHELAYKAPISISDATRRSLHRLMALVELFDLEVSRVRKEIMEQKDFWPGQVIETLERDFLDLTGHSFDSELSRLIVDELLDVLPANEPIPTYLAHLDQFVTDHRQKLANIFRDYLTDDRHPLLSQPESLLIFERLESDRFRLRSAWPTFLPVSFLETMADIWGLPLVSEDDG